MKDIVRSYKMYVAWEYEKEERELNEASKKGLQLIKGGCYHSVFKKDNSVQYVYQLDYNTNIEDKVRYREAFEEQGWEYINSTYNGWHYFRKPYLEGVDEEEYKIYTDTQSLWEMQNRWVRFSFILLVMDAVIAVMNIITGLVDNSFGNIITGVSLMVIMIAMLFGSVSIKRRQKGKKDRFVISTQLFCSIYIVGFLIMIISVFI